MSRCIHQVYQEHREFPGIYIQYVSLKIVITGPDKIIIWIRDVQTRDPGTRAV